jgi:hypothetical protein
MSRFLHLAKRCAHAAVTLHSGISSATLTLTGTWPLNGSKLAIVASAVVGHTNCGSVGTPGLITINGGTPISFTQAARKTSTVSLSAIPTITVANMDCDLVITVLDSGLAPIYATVETDLHCKIEIKSKSIPAPQGGWTSIASTQMQARGHFEVGDLIKFDIDDPFDPTNGIEHPIVSFGPKAAYMGKEDIKILAF